MARKSNAQINIRSDFVRERAFALAAETGKTVTQVLEDAVRAYRPPPPVELEPVPDGFVVSGRILVQQTDRKTSLNEILEAIEQTRNQPLFHDETPID